MYLSTGQNNSGLMGAEQPAQQPVAQPPQQPQQAQPAPQPQKENQKPYNGTIRFKGDKAEIKDGVGIEDGKKIFVSPDGKIVWNEQLHPLGSVDKSGEIIPIDKDHMFSLIKSGRVTVSVAQQPAQPDQQGDA